jgi:hypothetical protein
MCANINTLLAFPDRASARFITLMNAVARVTLVNDAIAVIINIVAYLLCPWVYVWVIVVTINSRRKSVAVLILYEATRKVLPIAILVDAIPASFWGIWVNPRVVVVTIVASCKSRHIPIPILVVYVTPLNLTIAVQVANL